MPGPLPRTIPVPDLGVDAFPWEKLPDETGASYEAFVSYRDLGYRRTLRKATMLHYGIAESVFDPQGAHSGKSRVIERWSATHRWVARCEEYDRHLERVKLADDVNEVTEVRRRHVTTARLLQQKAVSALNAMDPAKMSLAQVAQALDIAVRIERQGLGMPEHTVAVTGADGGAVETIDVTPEVIERKLTAWLASRDQSNQIEAGEPGGADVVLVGEDDILPTDTPVAPSLAAEWPLDTDDGLELGGEPFPSTAGDDDDDDDE